METFFSDYIFHEILSQDFKAKERSFHLIPVLTLAIQNTENIKEFFPCYSLSAFDKQQFRELQS